MISKDTTPRDLAILLGTSLSSLTHTIYSKKIHNYYTEFNISKKGGGTRTIKAPCERLKRIQNRLKSALECIYTPHSAASAFIEGRGIIYNAKKHTKKAAVFNIDLENFYDSIHFGRVRGLLMAMPYSLRQDTAQIIAHICCADGTLPQGAPTSPVISNMIARKLDRELSLLAKSNKAFYTRYADDITFSFTSLDKNEIYLPSDPAQPSNALVDIVSQNGFSINNRKTRLQTLKQRQVVTGIKVNKKTNIDRRYIRTTRAMIHSLQLGIEEANLKYKSKHENKSSRVENVVYGRINFIGMIKGVDSDVYQTLANKFNTLDLPAKLNTAPKESNSKLERRLHFSSYKEKERLESSVWVVCFEGMDEDKYDVLVQGSAFMVKGQRLITATHIFTKARNPTSCVVYRINNRANKFSANIVYSCPNSDITELSIVCDPTNYFSWLSFSRDLEPHSGYKLSIIGFPQLEVGHDSVSIIPCTIINTLNIRSFRHAEVDTFISAGNSGGPVVNAYMQVVGMVVRGISATHFDGETHLEGRNAFISAKHFLESNSQLPTITDASFVPKKDN
ncbi:reverse transcriptase domain-containing protein [Hahella sp. CR1]|uniref:reverse transcriptase domain-containing protein n=1 Tax=Hahella sp. CR1 TaxID=2992807 RepID=UPI0024428280|nr:reverse transcriptase domain-containing protein [Hahella sp. CR1]MDG9669208.1 reverse transcriptase domain-containing protein [Hahella sp. CR1]